METVDYRNWMDGGTMITNFKLNDIGRYQKAIEIYHEKQNRDRLKVEEIAFYNKGSDKLDGYGSLHIVFGCDTLTEFWGIFNNLKKEIVWKQ